jgi:site-specific DNA-methyltransferase (adenine-specific)
VSQLGLGVVRDELLYAARALPNRYARLVGAGKLPDFALAHGNAIELLSTLPPGSVDLLFADPPYLLSNGGSTCSGGKRVDVHKGDWDESRGLEQDHEFHLAWLRACQRVLKRSGTIWVTGTHHCIFSVGYAMQQLGFHVLNSVTWFKPNASPNLGCRQLTHSTELAIWAAPAHVEPLPHVFNYAELKAENGGKQLRDCWELPVTPQSEKREGKHPTQKPLSLLRRIIQACAFPGAWVLDPFNGSGTTGLAALEAGCHYIGLDLDEKYLKLSARRFDAAGLYQEA